MTKEEMRQQAELCAKYHKADKLRDLFYENSRKPGIFKAGVIPYDICDGRVVYYLMKPEAIRPELGDPGYQIGKGTREIYLDGEWQNYDPRKHKSKATAKTVESLYVNAIREGIEELGLVAQNILSVQEWGAVDFKSELSGMTKTMWLFLCEVDDGENFVQPDETHGNTQHRGWFSLGEESDSQIRPDHLAVLKLVDPVLRRYLQTRKV